MTAFGDLFADSALPALQGLHGELVTYIHAGADNRTITAIIEEIEDLEADASNKIQSQREVLKVKVSRSPTEGIEAPAYGDAIRRNGLVYTHKGKVHPGNAGCWNLEFERSRPRKIGG